MRPPLLLEKQLIMLSRRLRARALSRAALMRLRRFAGRAQKVAGLEGMTDFLLAPDAELRALNRKFRGKNSVTDVLSFSPASGLGGEIAMAVGLARRQAREHGHALEEEIKILMLHGILHLAGMDHERDGGRMKAREELLRGRLGLPCGLLARSAGKPASRLSKRESRGVKRSKR